MDPHVKSVKLKKNTLIFTISNINVSLANALRRIILSEIPIVVIRSHPYEKNDVTIHINTSRLNNEIIKQRLSCIPIYIHDTLSEEELREYEVVVEKKNTTGSIEFITTEDFRINHRGKELSLEAVHKIFPPDPFTKDYILFARLRPKISEAILGEELKLTAKLSMGTAKENSMFNVVSTCSYAMTPDEVRQYDIWGKKETELEKEGYSAEDMENEKINWFLSEGRRIYIENSFDFVLETLGIHSNVELMKLAVNIINDKLTILEGQIVKGEFPIQKSLSTLPHAFDLTLQNEDYTIGKALEFILYDAHFKNDKTLAYLGFLKKHPHDDDSIIRMAFREMVDETTPLQYLSAAIIKAKEIFASISSQFN